MEVDVIVKVEVKVEVKVLCRSEVESVRMATSFAKNSRFLIFDGGKSIVVRDSKMGGAGGKKDGRDVEGVSVTLCFDRSNKSTTLKQLQ
jgi:hypothetical protein